MKAEAWNNQYTSAMATFEVMIRMQKHVVLDFGDEEIYVLKNPMPQHGKNFIAAPWL